jgi:hypothetical protein
MPVSPPKERQVFRAPTLDRVLPCLDFTAFTDEISTRRRRLRVN